MNVLIIGGGASGMMAALNAAQNGIQYKRGTKVSKRGFKPIPEFYAGTSFGYLFSQQKTSQR